MSKVQRSVAYLYQNHYWLEGNHCRTPTFAGFGAALPGGGLLGRGRGRLTPWAERLVASVPSWQLQREVLGMGVEAEAGGQGGGEEGEQQGAAAEQVEREGTAGGQEQGAAAAERHGKCTL